MKKREFIFIVSIIFTTISFSQVGIGTVTPDESSILDISSTTQGLLIPRMTGAQRDAIANPSNGLLLVNIDTGCMNYYNAAVSIWFEVCGNLPVVESCPGTLWMDRNLGASQIAINSTDALAYGYLYQWGREEDGHQLRTSANTVLEATSATDSPGHGNFIITQVSPFDWRIPQNSSLWQGVSGTNNPCPAGFRIPTEAELECERLSWVSNNATGAFASPLKLTVGGTRERSDGNLLNTGDTGNYWSSTVSGTRSRDLFFQTFAGMYQNDRSQGYSIRCIKD